MCCLFVCALATFLLLSQCQELTLEKSSHTCEARLNSFPVDSFTGIDTNCRQSKSLHINLEKPASNQQPHCIINNISPFFLTEFVSCWFLMLVVAPLNFSV